MFPNLKKPETFNEKIQWLKIYDRNPFAPLVVDRIASKFYVQAALGDKIRIPKILWCGYERSLPELENLSLPKRIVLKANHASQCIMFADTEDDFLHKIKSSYRTWNRKDHFSSLGEWAYKYSQKCIVAEEFLGTEKSVPDDYKFFVFNGKVKVIQLDVGRFNNHQRSIYSRDWDLMDVAFSHPKVTPNRNKPVFLNQMLQYAEQLAAPFKFARVDFYYIENEITFGEITLYPGAGFEKFREREFDLLLGSFLDLR